MLHLAQSREVVLYDQRGGGQSRAPNNDPVTWRDHVADVASVAREMGLDRVSLVGYSWGGLLSMLYALATLDDPALPPVARLALVSPAPVTSVYRQEFEANLRARSMAPAIVAERERVMASGLRERDPEAYRQRIFELGVMGYFADTADANDLTPFRVVGRVQQSTWESLGEFDLRPSLARLHVPARVVVGRDDPIPLASSEDVARLLEAELDVIPRCGHVPYVERPLELWEALDPFLASTDAVAGSAE
jgi:proline iminopeptidase